MIYNLFRPTSKKEKDRIPFQNLSVEDGDKLNILGQEVKVIEVLGHTRSHISFYFLNNSNPVLFIGDTLFSGGCGRIFEVTYEQMYASLERIKLLPRNNPNIIDMPTQTLRYFSKICILIRFLFFYYT